MHSMRSAGDIPSFSLGRPREQKGPAIGMPLLILMILERMSHLFMLHTWRPNDRSQLEFCSAGAFASRDGKAQSFDYNRFMS